MRYPGENSAECAVGWWYLGEGYEQGFGAVRPDETFGNARFQGGKPAEREATRLM